MALVMYLPMRKRTVLTSGAGGRQMGDWMSLTHSMVEMGKVCRGRIEDPSTLGDSDLGWNVITITY